MKISKLLTTLGTSALLGVVGVVNAQAASGSAGKAILDQEWFPPALQAVQ